MLTNNILFVIFSTYILSAYSEPCPNLCSAHGRCLNPGRKCECYAGYTGGDCSQYLCPEGPSWADLAIGIDDAHNEQECSNMGICDRTTGVCSCQIGFSGAACERKDCPNQCNNYGKCQSMSYYALTKDAGVGPIYTFEEPWDADMMYGCNCDLGFYGPACSLRTCPTGDDPLTGVGVSTVTNPTQFNAVQRVSCKAGGGTFTLTFRGKTTARIPFNAKAAALQSYLEALPSLGVGSTQIVMFGSQACLDSGTSWTVEFLQHFGDLPLMVPDEGLLTFSDALNLPTLTVSVQTIGTKETSSCSNRGLCDATTGTCTCSTNFDTSDGYNGPGTRGDCGYATQTIQQCPGAVACSAHGQCSGNPTYECSCSAGWTGADCSYRTCATGVSWFTLPEEDNVAHISEQVECSDMGVCDRVAGVCVCATGFTGTSCSRMVCPGNPTECSGHGVCLDMMALAALAVTNGDNSGFTYGATPNNPLTWDANMVRGCYCDEGYEGYDCSLSSCPTGDDPLTTFQADEKQTIKCTSASGTGSLVFTFREETGYAIGAVQDLEGVQTMLESIPSVGKVIVELVDDSQSDQLCSAVDSPGVVVTFLTTHGDLPLLKISTIDIDSILVEETLKGTKENDLCSGRGLCETSTGICQCFTGFGSSDGMTGSGTLADCGYVEPIIAISTA